MSTDLPFLSKDTFPQDPPWEGMGKGGGAAPRAKEKNSRYDWEGGAFDEPLPGLRMVSACCCRASSLALLGAQAHKPEAVG